MKIIKPISGILFLLLLYSCSINQYTNKEISGRYYKSPYFESYSELNLYSNSTFKYNWKGVLIGGETKGSWYLSKNKIILNSDKQPSKKKIKHSYLYKASFNSKSDSLQVTTLDTNLASIPYANIYIRINNAYLVNITQLNGKCKLEWLPGKQVGVSRLEYSPITAEINDSINELEFVLTSTDSNEYYKYFTDYKVKIIDEKNLLFEKYDERLLRKLKGYETKLILEKRLPKNKIKGVRVIIEE